MISSNSHFLEYQYKAAAGACTLTAFPVGSNCYLQNEGVEMGYKAAAAMSLR